MISGPLHATRSGSRTRTPDRRHGTLGTRDAHEHRAEFFQELETDYQHDGTTRHRWVADVLEEMLAEPHDGPVILLRPSTASSTNS